MAIALLALSSSSAFAGAYTLNRAQIDLNEVPNVVVVETKEDAAFAEVGAQGAAYAKARVTYGNNGVFAEAVNQAPNLGAYAESIWVDSFTIGGHTGTGTLDINVSVTGTLNGVGTPGESGPNAFYQLFFSNAPIECDFDAMSCTGSQLIPLVDGLSGSRTFSAQLNFTYGQTFYLASYLGAEVLGNGVSDFYGSAHFGATASGGEAIAGSSGFIYALASSVPEPAAPALLLAGLAALGLARRKSIA